MKRKLILGFLTLLVTNSAFSQEAGGPYAYGYTWKSSRDASGQVKAKWVDLTAEPGALNITDRFIWKLIFKR